MTKAQELFEIPYSPSPRLAWLTRHGLTTRRLENGKYICVLDDENIGQGETEDDAIIEFCMKTQLNHWNQE